MDSLTARRAPLLAVLVAATALALALIGAPQAHAADCTTSWTNASGGRWNTASNWSAGVPDANDVACIQAAGTYTVEIRAYDDDTGNGLAVAQELHLGGLSGTQTLLISGATLTAPVDPNPVGGNLVLVGGVGSASDVGANGAIMLQAVNTSSTAELCAGSPLTSDGTISTLGSSGPAISLRGSIKNRNVMTLSKDATLQSSAGCGTNQLENDGGTVSVGNSRTLSIEGSYVQGSGTTDLKEDGHLTVGSAGSLTMTGGEFIGTDNTPLVDGGDLVAPGGSGTFRMHGASTLDSDVGPNVTVNLEGTAAEHASVSTVGGAGTNQGTINLTSLDASHGALLTASDTLTNTGEIVAVPQGGGIRNLGGTIANQGLLQIGEIFAGAEFGTDLALTNTGTFEIAEGGKFTIDDDVLNQNGGTLSVGGALDLGSNNLTLAGGTLKGTGTVKVGTLTNSAATVAPGNSPGQLMVDGNYTQASGGTLDVEVQGQDPGTGYDRLIVLGTTTLGGTLKVTTTGGQTGQFQILIGNPVGGSFASTQFTGQNYTVETNSTGVFLSGPPANTTKPFIVGAPRVGNMQTCNLGIWVAQGSPAFTYRWLRDGVPLAAATAKRKVQFADQGHKLACRVTGTNAAGSGTATSNPVSVPKQLVKPGVFTKLTLRATPAGLLAVPVRNPNLVAASGVITLRTAKGKLVGQSAKFPIGALKGKTVALQLAKGVRDRLGNGTPVKLTGVLVLTKGAAKRTTKRTLTVRPPA